MKDVERELIATALPYWEVEATIVRRFFKNKPTREDHIFWLKAQLWKELHPVDGYFTGLQKELNNLVASFPEIDKTIGRHRYHSLLEQLTQEFNHYVLMADVLEYLLGHPVSAEDTFQLPQEKKLGDIRRGYATSGSAIDKAADVSRRKKVKRRPARKNDRRRHGSGLSRRKEPLQGSGERSGPRGAHEGELGAHEKGRPCREPAASLHAQ